MSLSLKLSSIRCLKSLNSSAMSAAPLFISGNLAMVRCGMEISGVQFNMLQQTKL